MGRKYSGKRGICRRVESWVVSSLVLFVLMGIKGRRISEGLGLDRWSRWISSLVRGERRWTLLR